MGVIWNRADPVLEEYAPPGGEPAYLKLTIDTLRRHGSKTPTTKESFPTSGETTVYASLWHFVREEEAPEVLMLVWKSRPGTHTWPSESKFSFDAAKLVTKFFLGS